MANIHQILLVSSLPYLITMVPLAPRGALTQGLPLSNCVNVLTWSQWSPLRPGGHWHRVFHLVTVSLYWPDHNGPLAPRGALTQGLPLSYCLTVLTWSQWSPLRPGGHWHRVFHLVTASLFSWQIPHFGCNEHKKHIFRQRTRHYCDGNHHQGPYCHFVSWSLKHEM